MKPAERDNLLIELKETFGRIDERTQNIYSLTEKQEAHLSKLNESMLKHAVQISTNKGSIKWIRMLLIAVGLLIIGIIGGGITGLFGWFG